MRDGFTSTLLDLESENILLSKCLLAVLLILSGLCHNAADVAFSVFGDGVSRSQTVAHKASGGPSRTLMCALSDTQWPPSEDLPVKRAAFHWGHLPLLPPTQTIFVKGTKDNLLFQQLMHRSFFNLFLQQWKVLSIEL